MFPILVVDCIVLGILCQKYQALREEEDAEELETPEDWDVAALRFFDGLSEDFDACRSLEWAFESLRLLDFEGDDNDGDEVDASGTRFARRGREDCDDVAKDELDTATSAFGVWAWFTPDNFTTLFSSLRLYSKSTLKSFKKCLSSFSI